MAQELQAEHAATIRVETERDVVKVRDAVRNTARAVGLSLVDETKIVTAASELGRNLVTHATGKRTVAVSVRKHQGGIGVCVVSQDEGPGIKDLDLALGDGFSTAQTLGIGLPGTRRIVDDFEIESTEAGTRVEVIKWRR